MIMNTRAHDVITFFIIMHGVTIFNTSICSQEPVKGNCRAHLQRWYYNSSSGNCSVFYYGGCGGNENRFLNCQECMGNCSFANFNETASNITAICNELEDAADQNDSREHDLIYTGGNEIIKHHVKTSNRNNKD
uniref:Putative kunitz n=1 Tax=Rhipicephalus microplus TaxID=6941 RepID=A0A6G5A557_RHIMP